MKIRPYPTLSQPVSFYCLELSEKQLLQVPNADAVILDSCCSCASSRIDNISYYQLLASSWNNKGFADTVFGSY